MAGAQFITLLHATSRSSLVKPISNRSPFYNPIKNYGQAMNGNRGRSWIEERAPSTAEEFQRVADEKKAKKAQQGVVATKTVGAEDATVADTKRFSKEG
ncbi:hypothetical protein TanjilG_00802 [Lupinus angustifolius]|uniref:Uncharacterized protein n=1 Tax=Lupinus angustifolius TaxID=3871 RepID=A0A4P1R825_LUPAN|nr:PREDICTED: uncharacterized protein LOC109357057 [Lupinus angustifolius]OIW04242.1 hypothetical protein TanjilG_00802 [Lupinus angustifolius]